MKKNETLSSRAKAHADAGLVAPVMFADVIRRPAEGKDASLKTDKLAVITNQVGGSSICCHFHDLEPDVPAGDIWLDEKRYRRVARHYGFPEAVARLMDVVCAHCDADAGAMHVAFAEAIDGAGDAPWPNRVHEMFTALLGKTVQFAGISGDLVSEAIALHSRAASGETISDEDWSDLRQDALEMKMTAEGNLDEPAARAASAVLRSCVRTPEALSVCAGVVAKGIAENGDGSVTGAFKEVGEAAIAKLR